MRLNPHLPTIALDGTWHEQGNELVFAGLGHLKTSQVGDVLEHAVRRIERHLGRCGLLGTRDDDLDLTTNRSARLLMGSLCTRPPAQADSMPRVARHCCATSCALRLRWSEWSSNPTA